MKTYNFPELKKIAKSQNYKTASLENLQGEKLFTFNNPSKDINKQLLDIENRISADILTDGYYNVLMALNVKQQKHPDKYTVIKGNPTTLKEAPIKTSGPDVLTWNEALKLHSELAQLREENKTLLAENKELLLEVEILKAEITELEEAEPLEEEGEKINLVSLLKEHAPTLIAISDRYFGLEEKKLELRSKELDLKSLAKPKTITIQPGTREHLILIETHFKNKDQNNLDIELAALEKANPELFAQVVEKLNEQNKNS